MYAKSWSPFMNTLILKFILLLVPVWHLWYHLTSKPIKKGKIGGYLLLSPENTIKE